MDNTTYRLVFQGKISEGEDVATVKERLAMQFNLDGNYLERLFSGSPVAVKSKLPLELALKYRQFFEQSGALCELEQEETYELSDERLHRETQPGEVSSSPVSALAGQTVQESSSLDELSPEISTTEPGAIRSSPPPQYSLTPFSHFWCFLQAFIAYLGVYSVALLVTELLNWKVQVLGIPLPQALAVLVGASVWERVKQRLKKHGPVTVNARFWGIAAFFLLGISGAVLLTKGAYQAKQDLQNKELKSVTQTRLDSLQVAMQFIQNAAFDGIVPFPDKPEQIIEITRKNRQLFPKKAWISDSEALKDEWGTPFHYERRGNMDYVFRSAGLDKVFGTNDDLRISSLDVQSSSSNDPMDDMPHK